MVGMREGGFRAEPYRDPPGQEEYWSVGFGHRLPKGVRRSMDIVEAKDCLYNDTMIALDAVVRQVKAKISHQAGADVERHWEEDQIRPREAALEDMAYNLGETKLARFVKMWAALKRGDMDAAAGEVLDSRYGRSKLTARRAKRNAEMIRTNTLPGRED